ncbi:MAG TPA: AMP-binding protein [Chloroflexota bacterium]|nr:AMP-binding protein [Chloroflexota bacterium]
MPTPSLNAAELLRRAAERNPGKTALVWEEGRLTYRELLRRVDRLSHALLALRVEKGDRVAILLHNGLHFVESWWAAVQIGGVAVPLSTRALPAELAATLRNAQASTLIAGPEFLETIGDLRRDVPSLRTVIGVTEPAPAGTFSYEDLVQGEPLAPPRVEVGLADPCAIYYTAGTTGASKGAVRSHLSVTWGLGVLGARIRHDEVHLGRAPMYHTGGSLTGPFAALAAGATLVSMRSFDARTLLETVQRERVTRLYLHPTLVANALFEELDRSPYDLGSVRYLQWTAGPLPEGTRAEILARFPGLPLETTYGMTEVSNIASYEYPGSGPLKAASCVGFGPPGTQLRIQDEAGQPAPTGERGEIVVRSPTAMSGYWRDPAATERVLAEGWLHTGDLGWLDEDGFLHLAGRQKDAIVTGGETVHASEVETVLASVPGLREAAVIGLPDGKWGEAITAVVVGAVEEAAILAACRATLPGYKCPKRIIFADSIPRNGIGKVLKRELVERYSDIQENARA